VIDLQRNPGSLQPGQWIFCIICVVRLHYCLAKNRLLYRKMTV
jgi:hypothetical protein